MSRIEVIRSFDYPDRGVRRGQTLVTPVDFRAASRASNVFTLPSWLAITCATTGRTVQTSASTLATGLGANAARAYSVDGSTWALLAELARINHLPQSDPFTGWTAQDSAITHVAGPSGATEAGRIVDSSAAAVGYGYVQFSGATIGIQGCMSAWLGNGVITSGTATGPALNDFAGQSTSEVNVQTTIAVGSDGQSLPQAIINVANAAAFPSSGTLNVTTDAGVQTVTYTGKSSTTFTGCSGGTGVMSTGGLVYLSLYHRIDAIGAYTVTDGAMAIGPSGLSDAASQGKVDAAFVQVEDGKYPTSAIVTAGAAASRAADVLSIASPSSVAPGGYFDVTTIVAPLFSTSEQAADADLLFLDSDNRVYLQQSTSKIVLRIGGNESVLTGALTWSRNQALIIRARHSRAGRLLQVTGQTTGTGSSTGSAAAAVTLPATAYVAGNASGCQEAWGVQAIRFNRAA